jgi:hypothetical protein
MMSKASDSHESWVLVLDSIPGFYAIGQLHFLLHTASHNQWRTDSLEQRAFPLLETFMNRCAPVLSKQ